MHLYVKNVNHAFHKLVEMIHRGTLPTETRPSRNGEVLLIEEPMTITYGHPVERVLFNPARDANPFFHLYESLWMLAGRNDVAPLAYYNSRIKDYSDDGKTFNGAYGYRWRKANRQTAYRCEDPGPGESVEHYTDQLDLLVNHLKTDPWSRRAVLAMWSVKDDLLKIGWGSASKDVCCNLNVMFAVEPGVCPQCGPAIARGDHAACIRCGGKPHDVPRYLNMTVTNRSNDLVWGALGANVVHFSFLQEYMAARLDLEVGRYHHFSNNLHCYTNTWKPEEWLKASTAEQGNTLAPYAYLCPPYAYPRRIGLVHDMATFEEELPKFVEANQGKTVPMFQRWREPFLDQVAQKMCHAFYAHKARDYDKAMAWMDEVIAADWEIAGKQWIQQRRETYESRTSKGQKADV